MSDSDFAIDDVVDKEVYDATGALLGTVADVDPDEDVMYIDPDPDVAEESWAAVGQGEFVNFDNNWLGIADYKVWNAGEADDDVDEWPYTLSVEYVEEVDGDEIRLAY